jgi:hypothetical protein
MARIKVDPDRTLGRLDLRVFGGFIEHLGRCVYVALDRRRRAARGAPEEDGTRLVHRAAQLLRYRHVRRILPPARGRTLHLRQHGHGHDRRGPGPGRVLQRHGRCLLGEPAPRERS